MSQAPSAPDNEQIIQLKSSASLMTFDAGLYCIFLAPEQAVQSVNGYPAVRVSPSPNIPEGIVVIQTLDESGLISAHGAKGPGAAIVRISRGPAQIMVTTYQVPGSETPSPGIQVARLSSPPQTAGGPEPAAGAVAGKIPDQPKSATPEVSAHIQNRGDVYAAIGEWMGEPGSQNWIEGFSIAPNGLLSAEAFEYQAVLGKGWLSPWAEAGQYCGSRGMALPILGLRVRLKESAAAQFVLTVTATFTDGTRVGPLSSGDALEAESLAPLEAFQIDIQPVSHAATAKATKNLDARHRPARKGKNG